MTRNSRKRDRDAGPDATPENADVATGGPSSTFTGQPEDQCDMWDQSTDAKCECDRSIAVVIDSNTELLERLLDHVSDLREVVSNARSDTALPRDKVSVVEAEAEQLRDRIYELESQLSELDRQNSDLASQVAAANVQQTVSNASSGCDDALSWEDRKHLILQQMEDDSFDAEEFASSLQSERNSENEAENPAEFVNHLHHELKKRDAEIARREDELQELRFVLEQQSETRAGGVAIGAAAIAEMIDSDELVQQERERLQLLQAEWEEKFRQGEIEASLERAKLSRERQELAKKQSELEEQLEHMRRESRHAKEHGSGSTRKWLTKLGLSDDGC